MNNVMSFVLALIAYLPKNELAALAGSILSLLATKVEGGTTDVIAHEAEVVAFDDLQAILASIAASPVAPAAPPASAA